MTAIIPMAHVFLITPYVLAGSIIYVDQAATGPTHNGVAWCSAYVDLQDALDVATAGDEIRVADGRYLPDRGTGDRATSFGLIDAVGVLGGFAGCGAPNPDARDVSLNKTTLSGDLNGNDALLGNEADCIAGGGTWYSMLCDKITNNDENAYHVVVSNSTNTSATVLDGFVISGGNANGPGLGATPNSQDQGSGINIYFGTPTLTNCIVENNRADNHGAVNDHGGATLLNCEIRQNFSTRWGGGLHNHTSIVTTATDCRFDNNATAGTFGGGGGMFVRGWPILTNCVFSGNVSAKHGGAMYNDFSAITTMSGCTLTGNSALRGGAFYNTDGGRPELVNCNIVGNTATEFGGGTYSTRRSDGSWTDCTFRANVAGSGGAIYLKFFSSPTLDGCTIIDNQSITPDSGGGFDGGGGLWMQSGTSPVVNRTLFMGNTAITGGGAIYSSFTTIAGTQGGARYTNCRFIGNTADYGGVIANYHDNVWFTNCIFIGNFAFGTSWRGGGGVFHNYQDNGIENLVGTNLNHCTVSGNASGTTGGAAYVHFGWSILNITDSVFWGNTHMGGTVDEASQIFEFAGHANVSIDHTLLQGWSGTFGGVGNFTNDPMFVSAGGADNIVGTIDDDLRLRRGSPALDVGNNASVPIGVTTDLDGNPRIVNGTVDLGAYELQVVCGDGTCDPDESPCTCPVDCGNPTPNEVPGLTCADGVDNDCDGMADCRDLDCATVCTIPAVSEWGVYCMMMLLLTAGSLVMRRRRAIGT